MGFSYFGGNGVGFALIFTEPSSDRELNVCFGCTIYQSQSDMIKKARKLTSAVCTLIALTCAMAMLVHWGWAPVIAQTEISRAASTIEAVAELPAIRPQWRYTRMGWQDANDWAMLGQIESPPERRFDNLHPAVVAMLILFSVLVSVLWASNEWELAQLVGQRK